MVDNSQNRVNEILMDISEKNGLIGILLIMLGVSFSKENDTVWIDEDSRIYLNPDFVDELTDDELRYLFLYLAYRVILLYRNEEVYKDKELFNEALDIVINSYIYVSGGYDDKSITIEKAGGVQNHLAPNGVEGCEFTVKRVYEMLGGIMGKGSDSVVKTCCKSGEDDKYVRWKYLDNENSDETNLVVDNVIKVYADMISGDGLNILQEHLPENVSSKLADYTPENINRSVDELEEAQIDWRSMLRMFIQKDRMDYSFSPPDRRYSETPFFLPGYVEEEESVDKVLFMIDTSGSMNRDEIMLAYSEVKGAVDQFDGHLKGWLGFFDSEVKQPVPFCDEDELLKIMPYGGGGTSFRIIFDYIRVYMREDLPQCIVILTDGYALIPEEEEAGNIPVLWLFTTDIEPPTWGKVVRIKL